MTDYYLEHGQHLPSAEPIRARFKLLNRFLAAELEAGRVSSPLLPDHIDDRLLDRFRAWGVADPIVARKKDENGNWIDGMSRVRAASTVEESVIQLKAALNYAFKARRVRYVPPLQHKTRDQVTQPRSYRLSLNTIGELLDYSLKGAGKYAGHSDRLLPLRRYLIASICTLARPDAIFDMNVKPEREQWQPDQNLFALNQAGRAQTHKRRPIMPVVPLLRSWLETTDEWFICTEKSRFDPKQNVDVIEQHGVGGIRTAWNGACQQFRIPDGWGPKLIRHSMATILANRGVDLIQLEMALGHRVLSKTSSRYAIFGPGYLASVRDGIEDVIADLTKVVGPALHAKLTQKSENVHVLRA